MVLGKIVKTKKSIKLNDGFVIKNKLFHIYSSSLVRCYSLYVFGLASIH